MSKKDALSKLASRIPSLITSKQSQEDRARVERALVDFPFFCKTYLKEYFYCDAAEYQKILYDVAQTRCITPEQMERLKEFIPEEFQGTLKEMEDIEGVVDVEPRGHGKSTRWTFAYPLWMALRALSRFILITSSDAPSARGQMAAIKYELDNNELIIQDFGIQHVKGKKWNANTIELANGVMISAYGKGSSMRGVKNGAHRPDYVIVDDAFKDAESDSETMRKKVINWFNKTVLPIGQPKTFFIMINTITHNEDLASTTLSKIAEGTMGRWVGLRFSAEVKEGQPLWPERYSWQFLKDMENKIGSLAYAQEYLSRALNDGDRMFQRSWFVDISDAEVPNKTKRYEGIDPATGKHDMSAVVDIATSKETGKIYVLGSHGKAESTQKFKDRLYARYATYRYRKAGMEAVAFQEVYKNEILRDGIRRGVSLPIKGMNPGRGSKAQRNMMLSPLIENGTIVFCPGNEMLKDQLEAFPFGSFDDLVDALYYAVKTTKMKGIDYVDEDDMEVKATAKKARILRRAAGL